MDVARQTLLRDLELAAALRGIHCTVVFDGAPIEDVTHCSSEHLTVLFAGPTASADSVIERLVCQRPARAPKGQSPGTVPHVVVVTNDRVQGNLVVGFGARCWSSSQLASWLHEPPS